MAALLGALLVMALPASAHHGRAGVWTYRLLNLAHILGIASPKISNAG